MHGCSTFDCWLQKLAWNGIPHNYRSSAWKIMLASLNRPSRKHSVLLTRMQGFMPAQEQRREVTPPPPHD